MVRKIKSVEFQHWKIFKIETLYFCLGVPSIPLGDASPPRHKILQQPPAPGELRLPHDVRAEQREQGPGRDVLLQSLHQLRGDTQLSET